MTGDRFRVKEKRLPDEWVFEDEGHSGAPLIRPALERVRDQPAQPDPALDAQLADRYAYFNLAADLEGFLTRLNAKAEVSTVQERQRVLRLLAKDILIESDKIIIRHRIPLRERTSLTLRHRHGG